jgi:diguanylate cyclase (GGDEF)-like protein
MEEIESILERLQYNEEVAQKFFEVEVSILSTMNFKDFLENLLTVIREKFMIPYVWISMIEDHDVAHQIRRQASSEVVRKRLGLVSAETFCSLVGTTTRPLLVNQELTPFYRLFPPGENYLVRSMAIAPITHQGEVIGSLNHGDPSESRYTPGMDTTLLERLGVKVSICLSNVIAHENLRSAASRDPLTGLLHRRVMESVLRREVDRSLRYGTPLSVAVLDIHGFKSVNERLGHDGGDTLLAYFGQHLLRMTRESDIVSRFSGDRFVITLPSTTMDEARRLVKRVEQFFTEHPLAVGPEQVPITFRSGLGNLQDSGATDAQSLLTASKEALYQVKKQRNHT